MSTETLSTPATEEMSIAVGMIQATLARAMESLTRVRQGKARNIRTELSIAQGHAAMAADDLATILRAEV